MSAPLPLPLEGITVVALEQAVAAPFASRQLADLGARVIKVERATGDFARGYDDSVHGMSSYFVWLNRGKESVVLDVKDPDDRAVLQQLVASADVLLQNLAPGAVERLGLGADEALALNPRLVHASISGYGRGGPDEQRKAYDLLVQCEAGLLSVTGTPDDVAKVGVSIADVCAGMYAYSGILAALYRRETTGFGEALEVSMLEALAEWVSQPLYYAMASGRAPARTGARHASIAPYGPFPTADGTVFLGVQNDREWASLCTAVLGRPDLVDDERFSSNVARVRHRDELDVTIGAALSGSTSAEAVERLGAAKIANARLRTMHELAEHPQLAARDRWHEVDSPVGPLAALRPPVTARGTGVRMGAVPALDEHGAAVRAEFSTEPAAARAAEVSR